MVDDQTSPRTSAKTTPPIVAARIACRAQRIELTKLAGQVSKLRYTSPAAHPVRAQATERMDRTRCKNGHPRQIVDGQPVKRCRECHREQNKRYRDRQREKLGKPKRKPATPRKTGLPVGWEETRQPRKPRKPNNRNKISDVNYMPWDEATADRFTAAALATLRRHDATDLADMLGLNQPERKTA